ncbi:MAG TPA: ATP-binding cassette domain-containing protein [Xanthomonadaceae bacterium]|nr:ATP-binding cassette domain-containing protein [Xanthomonadaceae bacterium]
MLVVDVLLERGGFRRRVQLREDVRVVALTGHSGAGKTSVLNAIAGLLKPTHGRIEVDGRVLFDAEAGIDLPVHERHVGYVFQDARLFPHMSVRRNLLYGARRGMRAESASAQPRFGFDDVVQLLGIGPQLKRRPANLSGGEAQRVAIGRALLSQPRILLLDEPLSALDRARREEVIPYLQNVRDRTPLPMVYVSHSLDEVRRLTAAIHDFD